MDSSSRRSSQGSERSKHNNDNNDNNITSPSDGNNEHSPEQKSRSATNSPTMHNVQRQDTDAEVETTYGGSEGGGNNSASDSHSSSPLLPMTRTHAAFVSKLYNMVEDPGIQDLIGWSERGDMFRVSNPTAFSKNVLPRYFKHNNWQSFVRQLNMYGFNKVNDMIHSNMRNENQTWEFRHPHFRRGQVDDLQNIKRKSVKSGNRSSARMASLLQGPGESSSEALQGGGAGVGGEGGASSTMQREYAYLEGRLQQITSTFSTLQSEMTSLRIILSKQQGVIEDIVQLIRSAEENQRTVDSSNASTPASENLSRKVNALRQQLQSIREPSLFTGPASLQQQTSDRTSSASPMSRILEAKKEQPPLPLGSPDSIPSRNISSSSPTTTLEQQQQQQQHHHHYSWPDQAFSSSQIYTRGIKLQHSEQQQEQDPAPRTKSSIMGLGERSHLLNPAPSSDTNRGKDLKRPRPAHEE